jgi:HNH endonuclease
MSTYLSPKLQQRVREHFFQCCAYCHLSNAIFEYDHIIPQTAGGQTVFENLCFTCPKCNRFKHNFQNATDPESKERVRLFHSQQDSWSEHFVWAEDKALLLGQSAVARATVERLKLNALERVILRQLWVEFGKFPPQVSQS